MKGSVITSTVLHVCLLVWLLLSFGSAKPLEVTAGEAVPVELITDMSQLQQGDKESPVKEMASKEVTKNEKKVDNAVNSGDNNFDLKSVPTPMDKPSNTQKAAAAKKSDVVAPQDTQEQDSQDNVKEDTAVNPSTEVAALEKPVVDVKPEPRPEPKPVEDKPAETAKDEPLPDAVPIPSMRPKEEPKKVEEKKEEPKKVEEKKVEEKKETKVADAKTDKDKKAKKDKENKKAKKSTTSKDSDFNANEVAELLSKVDNNSGGALRSTREKARGAQTTTSNAKLSQSELDALQGMIQDNWTIMPGQVTTSDIAITVHFELDESGNLVGRPEIVSTAGGDGSSLQSLAGGAVRAVMKSAPFDKLPKDKYDTWKTVTLTFHPEPA